MKTCRRCLIPKDESEFGINRYYETHGLKDGRAIYCKQCNSKHTAKMRANSLHLLKTTKVKVSFAALGYNL